MFKPRMVSSDMNYGLEIRRRAFYLRVPWHYKFGTDSGIGTAEFLIRRPLKG